MIASDLITAAKQATFTRKGAIRVSNAQLLTTLSMQDMLLVQMAAQIAPELLATITGSVTFSDSGNTNGYTLTNGIHYRDFLHKDTTNDKYRPINIIRRLDRHSNPTAPAGLVRTGLTAAVFYPVDPDGKEWANPGGRSWFEPAEGHEMSYSYVPMPVPITALSSALKAPQMAREVIVASLEMTLILNNPMATEAQMQMALAKYQGLLDSYRMQLYKFVNPAGQRTHGSDSQSDAGWVYNQVTG